MLKFAPKWKEEKPNYVKRHGEYKAFLDVLTEDSLKEAFKNANMFKNVSIKEFIKNANAPNSTITIEQGSHQPEDLEKGGFCLHFTARMNGKAFHFYIKQNLEGQIIIIAASYPKGSVFEKEILNESDKPKW